MRREEWLRKATYLLSKRVVGCADASPFEEPLVSVGFPKGKRGKKATAIGQCWDKASSGDKKRAHVYISPVLTNPIEVLSTLLHELVHVSVGNKEGHRGKFRTVALELGFEPPMTSTPVGEDLNKVLTTMSKRLGEYDHPGVTVQPRGSVGSRMLKVKCPQCGYTARTTSKWLGLYGPPICPCNNERMEES